MSFAVKIKNWFRNYWYYYKWGVIIVAAFAAIIIFCIVQSGDRKNYDVSILYTGPHIFEVGEKESLSSAFSQIMSDDYDGDGKKSVTVIDMPAFSDDQMKEAVGTTSDPAVLVKYAQYAADNVKQNFSQQVFSGDTVICLVDEYWYNIMKKADGLVKLEEILGYRPDFLVDDYCAELSELEFSEFFGSVSGLPDGTLICFRRLSTASAFTGSKEAERNYENSKKMLKEIFDFKAP